MLLEIKNLNIKFKTKRGLLHAIKDLSLSLEQGETLGLVGESGCGKSITNLAIMGLLPETAEVTADCLSFENKDLRSLSSKQWQNLRGADIAMIFQDPMSALNPCFTVGQQLQETLAAHTSLGKTQRHQEALSLLHQVGIPAPEERLRAYPHELSGGMAQRIMIAMAIACNPKLLIADEPTTALDVTIQDQILKLLRRLQKERNMAMIFVTHDLGVVANIADRIQVMYAGEMVERGETAQVIANPFHPYTRGLLDSLPSSHHGHFRQRLTSIAGMVPNLLIQQEGCSFKPRCLFQSEKCLKTPLMQEIGQRQVRCFHCLNQDQEKPSHA